MDINDYFRMMIQKYGIENISYTPLPFNPGQSPDPLEELAITFGRALGEQNKRIKLLEQALIEIQNEIKAPKTKRKMRQGSNKAEVKTRT